MHKLNRPTQDLFILRQPMEVKFIIEVNNYDCDVLFPNNKQALNAYSTIHC